MTGGRFYLDHLRQSIHSDDAVRLLLGIGQMAGSVLAALLIIQTGINRVSLTATVATGALTTASVLLFGSLGPSRGSG
jgi:hypothetical protein